jgi:hypothetical protein
MDNKIFIEFIFKDTHKTLKISNEKKINMILSAFFKNIPTLLCLDLHGVADLYDEPKETIPNNLPKCIISFLGNNPKTKYTTIKSIKGRLKSNEILLGILVYTKQGYPSCGTKGWVINKIISNNLNIKKIYFIDDSIININCINNINNPNIITYFIDKHISPKEQLNKILNNIN